MKLFENSITILINQFAKIELTKKQFTENVFANQVFEKQYYDIMN